MNFLIDSFEAERFWGAEELEREFGKIPEVFNFDVDKGKVEKRLRALLIGEVEITNALEGLTPVETLWVNHSLPYFTDEKERAKYDSFDEWYSKKTEQLSYLFQLLPYEDFVPLFYAAVKDLMCEKGTTTITHEKLKQALKDLSGKELFNCIHVDGSEKVLVATHFDLENVITVFYNAFKDVLFDYIENVKQGPTWDMHVGIEYEEKDLLFLVDNLLVFLKNTIFKSKTFYHFVKPRFDVYILPLFLYNKFNKEDF